MATINSLAPRAFMSTGWRSACGTILRLVDDLKPDVVLATHSGVNGFVAMNIHKSRGIPYVTVDQEIGDFLQCRESNSQRALIRQVVMDAGVSVTISDEMQRTAREIVPEGRFQTIYNGAGFDACDAELLKRHVEKSNIQIFCCGNLYGRKDIPLLINAFSAVAQAFPAAQLRIAGDGPDRDAVEKLVRSLECRERIHLLGSIDHSSVQQEMLQADIFALVGWAEPFGVVFLEAMANGCPVIVSSDAGVAEILKDRETAMLTQPRDLDSVVKALETLCGSHGMRRRIAEAGHDLYRDFGHWKHRAVEYMAVLESVVNNVSSRNH